MFSIAIIGVGRVGGALALVLSKRGYEVIQLVTRSYEKAREIAELIEPRPQILNSQEFEKISADIIFITTPDSEIPEVAETLAERLEHLPYVFHTSGSLSSDVLKPLNNEGCEVASIHPLVSISDPRIGAERFGKAYFCVEGDEDAVRIATYLVEDLQGHSFSIQTKYKPLYHAAAVTACGHVVSLISTAVKMLSDCGLDKREGQRILYPLIESTIKNLATQTPDEALTGTFARAEVGTLKGHLEALKEFSDPETAEIYKILGLRSIPLARLQGANEARLMEMEEVLSKNQR